MTRWNGNMFRNPDHSDLDASRRDHVECLEAEISQYIRNIQAQAIPALKRVSEVLPELDEGYHKLLYRWLSVPFAVAQAAQSDNDLLRRVYDLMPVRVKRYDAIDILRHTLQIAGRGFKLRTSAYNRACERERALRPFFERGVHPLDLPRLIEEAGGIGALDVDQRGHDSDVLNEDLEGSGGTLPHVSGDRGSPGGDGKSVATKAARLGARVSGPTSGDGTGCPDPVRQHQRRTEVGSRRRSFVRSTDLAVTMGEEELAEVLALPEGASLLLHVVVGAPRGRWKVLQAEGYEVEGESSRRASTDFGEERGPTLHPHLRH